VYLLLGDSEDPCVRGLRGALRERGLQTCVVASPMSAPARLSWWLDTERSESVLSLDGEPPIRDDQLDGVFVLGTGWVDAAGWDTDDLAYVQAETQAALLGWLWSLPCPVVNRYPPAIWLRPQAPLLSWHGLLHRSGLPTLETMVTSVEHEARAFGEQLVSDGVDGAVYGPLTSGVRYLVASERDWTGLAALQQVTPVSLTAPHAEARTACVVGRRVVWDDRPSEELTSLEPALREFGRATGLALVEVSLASAPGGLCVIAVETRPRLERFGEAAREEIVAAIVEVLTAPAGELAAGAHS
jgi:hypothetical protein